MTDFKGIRGWKVQTLSTDPVASQFLGGSWSTGGSLNTGRYGGGGDFGTQTAAMVATDTGTGPGPTLYGNEVEQYNGTSWTEVAEVNTGRFQGASGGTQAAGILASGRISTPSVTTNVELWNGSAWTETTENNNGRFGSSPGIGTSTAMVFAGGQTITAMVNHVESWNGSAWTEIANYPNSWDNPSNAGTSTAAIYAGGFGGPVGRGGDAGFKTAAYNWNGTSYTAVTSLPGGRSSAGSSGSQTDAMVFAGNTPSVTATNLSWDGSSWTEGGDLATARTSVGAAKSNSSNTTSSIAYGGPPPHTDTEEWNAPSTFSKINLGQVYFNSTANAFKVTEQPVPGGTWASGGSLNTARGVAGAGGTQTSAIVAGGSIPPSTAVTETYDGTSYTEVADLNTARAQMGGAADNSTAALVFGGSPSPAITESWNGSAWTEVSDLNTGRFEGVGIGISTAALYAAGYPNYAIVEEWNGSAWTEIADLNSARYVIAGSGDVNKALVYGGYNVPSGQDKALTESWDGSSWTEVADLNTARNGAAGAGYENTQALAYGAALPTNTITEFYNGSSWTEVNDLSTGRSSTTGIGTSATAALASGGPGGISATEEWTVPVTNKTITVS